MTVIVNAASSRSNSRTKVPGRMSLTKLRQGSSGGQGPSSTLGGQPLNGADPKAPRDIKHRFEITRKLGSGTYGKVSLAYDHKTEREVAVKLIKKSAIENKQDLIRIRREIRIMSMLKHPNVIQIYEVFENKDKIILVMEYASGGELYDYVSKFGSLPEAEARRVFRQVTSAILYCHKHRVAHRDLKLENILLDIDNNAKIADFGLSNYFADKTLLNTFCGSPLYASPEIINGTPYTGPEVDCWSLGILLYCLVYGSMPFDGHDFNRMVRQIKRGAYYEPDTPSTASMLIRNMLRVNPERRADIDDIASHWWLNLDEGLPAIQELPENQVIDETPLTERAETMVVQDLADETDVFMEFGHLSAATRQKIEEFRRRRQHAEEYNENSPIKPPKNRKTDDKELTVNEKSLQKQADSNDASKSSAVGVEMDAFHDPLERLRQLESRLQTRQSPDQPSTSKERRNSKPSAILPKASQLLPTKKEPDASISSLEENKRPHFVSPTEAAEGRKSYSKKSLDNGSNWKTETDSLNLLMNQVLEQMDKGPVSINLVARVRAHPMYDIRPMVKELLESIIAAQPASVRKEASKVIDQAQGLAQKQLSGQTVGKGAEKPITSPIKTHAPATIPETHATGNKYQVVELPTKIDVKAAVAQKRLLEDRKWHSVEVGFETDEESSSNGSGKVTKLAAPSKSGVARETRSAGHTMDEEDEDIEDESEYESEIDELAEVVEQVSQSSSQLPKQTAPKIVESLSEAQNPPQQPEISADHLSTLERGLAKRISKGKYQHNHIELYGRGLSTEANSPPPEKQKIGGPQPTIQQLPVLFDKAKKFIMKFPEKPEDSDDESAQKKAKTPSKKWTKSQDPDLTDKSATATPTPKRRISDATESSTTQSDSPKQTTLKSQQKAAVAEPKIDAKKQQSGESDNEEDDESEDEGEPIRKPRTSAIIGFRTIQTGSLKQKTAFTTLKSEAKKPQSGEDGSRREAPIAEIRPQVKPYAGINAIATPPPKSGDKEIGEKSAEISSSQVKTRASVDKVDDKADSRKGKTSSTIAAKVERRHSQLERKNSRSGAEPTTRLERRNSRAGVDSTPIGLERKNSRVGADTPKTDGSTAYRSERRPSRDLIGAYGRQSGHADRRKSFHEYSPVDHDDFATVYGASNRAPPSPGNFAYGATQRHTAAGASRFGAQASVDEEVFYSSSNGQSGLDSPGFNTKHFFGNGPSQPSTFSSNNPAPPTSSTNYPFYPSSDVAAFMALQGIDRQPTNYEPSQPSRRFEVYQTRAEREAKEAANVAIANYGSSYRPTTQHYSDRPVSSYISGNTGGYKSRYEDYSSGSSYRRPYDDRSFEMDPYFVGPPDYMPGPSGAGFGYGSSDPSYGLNNNNRFRPVSRRLGAGIRDVDGRRARARSHSSDQKYSGTSIDVDAAAALASRMMTPDNGGIDYSYVSYHDSSNARASQTREPDLSLGPTRGILKNKQAFEIEPRASQQRDIGGSGSSNYGLRRHMSAEKDLYMSPFVPSAGPGAFRYGSIGPSVGNAVHHHPPSYSVYAPANYAVEVPKTSDFYEPSASTKKRNSTGGTNFLSTTRRRTAEIRLGNDGKLSTTQNGYLIDDDYSKRPRSPIDRIKSLFGGGIGSSTKKTTGTAGTSGAYTGSNGVSSRYTPGTSTTGAGSSQFNKRYTGATTNTRYGHYY